MSDGSLGEARAEIERLRNEITGWAAGARFVRAERDAANTAIARVKALAEQWASYSPLGDLHYAAGEIRAALSVSGSPNPQTSAGEGGSE